MVASTITKPRFGAFFCCDHILDCSRELLMILRVIFGEVLELTAISDTITKGINDLII
jgi:hypothetical protein